MKRKMIFPALLSAAMMFGSVMPVGAVNITVDGNAKQYQAYRLLDLTTSLKKGDTHGEDEHTKDCYNYSYTVNSKYGDLLRASATGADANGDGTVSDDELISFISSMDATQIRAYADAVWGGIAKDTSITADYTSEGKIITTDQQGYYLIVESQPEEDPDSVSLVMLDTAGAENIKVTAKEDTPTLEKKVKLEGSADYVDAVDAFHNETVSFKLTGDMPSNIGNYKTYKYVFHDVMSKGLELKADTVAVTLGGEAVAAEDYTVTTSGTTDNCTFEVAFTDIKAVAEKLGVTLSEDVQCVVTYNALVTADAISGNVGNPNSSHLEFSNDPYVTDSTSTTPDDTVKVFQFTVVIDKVDKDGDPVTGAGFTLYKAGEAEGEWNEVSTLSTNEAGTEFTFGNLDQGSYKLVESVVPEGYNKADDVYFELEAVYDTESENPLITSFVVKQNGEVVSEGEDAKFQISDNLGTASGAVVNTTGIQLPHTGEFGRAILLYGGISMMILAGAVVVVGKKFKEDKNEA